jgi:Xaa-Pro aminopeptidase
MTEIQVANEYWKYVSSRGASALSFETIVGFGDHSADIHGIPSNRKLKRNEIILVDCGCILDGYCSDITRCWYVGKLPKRLDDMYKAVLNSNLLGIKNIKSNMLGKQGDSICRQYIADKWNGYDIPHGVGHGIGIGEHELPGNNKIGDRKLEINSCFTIEPGIYEQDLGGIRIEDTVVMTKNGCKVLTSSCKK